jgi:hypothetical protein
MPITEYPRHVYRRGGVFRVVTTPEDYTQALADGWEDRPSLQWPVPEVYRVWTGEPEEPEDAAPSVAPEPAAPPVPVVRPRGRPRKSMTADKG